MKKTAVLIDAGFLRTKLPRSMRYKDRAARIERFANSCIDVAEEELYRIFYYDCPLYEGKGTHFPHPVAPGTPILPPSSITYSKRLLDELRKRPFFAVRCGEMSFDGWIAKESAIKEHLSSGRRLTAADFKPNLKQKGVDLRIGVDLTLMSKDKIVDRIVLVAGDSDMVPAMKLARREGIQIVLVSLGHGIKPLLREHADIYRAVAP